MQRTDAKATFAPVIVSDRGQIVDALVERRHALGWTGEDLDERAGWADRYAGKLEAPTRPAGKLGFHFDFPCELTPTGTIRPSGMATVWLESLGLTLVLVDTTTADAIGAVHAPAGPPRHRPTPFGDTTQSHAERRRAQGRGSAMSAPAFETADRTFVMRQAFRAVISGHPWLVERPALKAQAEDIEAAMSRLYDEIRESP